MMVSCIFSNCSNYIFCFIIKPNSLLQLIARFDDLIHHDLDDTGEAPGFVCLLLTGSAGQLGLLGADLLVLQGCGENSPANTSVKHSPAYNVEER